MPMCFRLRQGTPISCRDDDEEEAEANGCCADAEPQIPQFRTRACSSRGRRNIFRTEVLPPVLYALAEKFHLLPPDGSSELGKSALFAWRAYDSRLGTDEDMDY
ncbi:hypothetical protein CEXT_649491 [Caerostris extrusa]|uniref:Uncharacterized protein n=1 Tax=Caerostris extrusa TaxID=172846 RepID=A0AAV4W9G3_CAEEX|nr:hypothetical protein CEXT_649491 [Caerostris extrusa]